MERTQQQQQQTPTQVAHIWKTSYGWMLELAEGNPVAGWRVTSESKHATKLEAKRAAHMAGAQPWNY